MEPKQEFPSGQDGSHSQSLHRICFILLNKAFIDLYHQYSEVPRYMVASKNIVSFFYLLIHLSTLGRTGGGGSTTLLSQVYSYFFLFSVAVRFFPRAHCETSLVLVSCYVYEV